MLINKLMLVTILALAAVPWDGTQVGDVIQYYDAELGYSFSYPDYWVEVTDVDEMLRIQDGTIDLIHEELLTDAEKESYQVMIHVDGTPRYLSNTVFLAKPHNRSGRAMYSDSESAVLAVVDEFEAGRESGTYLLENIYLGESHTYVYRRMVPVNQWNDQIRVTYYITASTTHAYMVVETILMSQLDDVTRDHFNQMIQSFRVDENEVNAIDPSLDWGSVKPGEDTEMINQGTEVGDIEIVENFDNNNGGWPVGDDAKVRNGSYVLDSRGGYPFTVRNTSLGQIGFDFSYEGSVTFEDGDEASGYGLVYGYRDEDNYYAFLITRGGQYLVIEEKGGVVNQLVPWTSSPLLTSGDTHRLMVQGDYQTITDPVLVHRYEVLCYIDGEQVANVSTERVLEMSGWFGVFVSTDLNVAFDWLKSRNYLLDAVMTIERFE
jgi:hypothetical protein